MDNDKAVKVNISGDSEIRKSKALLFAQTIPSNLPIAAQRLFLALLTNIDEKTNSDGDGTFIIRGKDIADLANLSPNVVGQQLEEMSIKADSLRQYTMVIKEEDGNDLRVGLISSTKYLKGQRAIRVNIDKFLMPYLHQAKEKFVISYTAAGPMKFRSEYSIRLYEMLNYYLADGHHYFTMEEMRTVFNIPKDRVKSTSTLNQKVIAPAMRDINKFTSLNVEMSYEKRGRTIIGYHFEFKDRNQLALQQTKEEDEAFITMLISKPYCFNKLALMKLISEFGLESIKNNFKYTKQHNPSNFSRYLHWAIKSQVYEKETEIRQIEAVNKALKNGMTPPPCYKEQMDLFIEEDIEASKEDAESIKDRIKIENPKLYEIMCKIQNHVDNK